MSRSVFKPLSVLLKIPNGAQPLAPRRSSRFRVRLIRRSGGSKSLSRIVILSVFVLDAVYGYSQSELRLATGIERGAYRVMGQAIERVVEENIPSFQVRLVASEGSVENAALLEAGQVDLALIQNDVLADVISQRRRAGGQSTLFSVLVMMEERVQVVAGPQVGRSSLTDLSGRRLALGHAKSGSRFTAEKLLQALGVSSYVELSATETSSIADMLRSGEADAGIYVNRSPVPDVASLLADTSFRILPFTMAEKETVQSIHSVYASASIARNTYSNQPAEIPTLAVLTVLVCRSDLDYSTAELLTTVLLEDLANPIYSILKQAHPSSDLSTILRYSSHVGAPVHPGADKALRDLPLRIRLRAYIHWIQWSLYITLACAGLFLSMYRPSRIVLMRVSFKMIPLPLHEFARWFLFHRILWNSLRALSFLCVTWLLGAAAMYFAEREVNVNFSTLKLASLSVLTYLFSGLEDRAPITAVGWVGSVFMLIAGLLVAAYITGLFASEFIQHTLGGKIMARNVAQQSLLIVGWNPRSEFIVREFFEAFETGVQEHSITILSEDRVDKIRLAEYESRGVTFVSGDTCDKKLLSQIGAHRSKSMIILADDSAEDPDGKTALIVLAMRSLCKELKVPADEQPRICVEVRNHRKMGLIRDAGAQEVVCHEDYGLGILVQAAFSKNIVGVYDDLLRYSKSTCETYILTTSARNVLTHIPEQVWREVFEGKSFSAAMEVFRTVRDHRNPAILIGIERDDEIILNPRSDLNLTLGDSLIVIAWEQPRLDNLATFLKSRKPAA